MAKINLLSVVFILLMSALTGCLKDKTEDDFEVLGNYREPVSMSNNSVVKVCATIEGSVPPDLRMALESRFTDIGAMSEDTQILILDSKSLEAFRKDVVSVYNRNGIVVVVNPIKDDVNSCFKSENIDLTVDAVVGNSLLAINQTSQFTLGAIPEGADTNEYLNSFISWINHSLVTQLTLNSDPGYTTDDIVKLFDAQIISNSFNLYLKKTLNKIIFSQPDVMEGRGSVDMTYTIVPLYAFSDQQAHGDYYVVTSTLTVHNDQMYRDRYTNRHGGVHVRMCGFYLKSITASSSLHEFMGLQGDYKHVGEFPSNGAPVPTTTIGKSSYTSGFSWDLKSAVTGGVVSGKKGDDASAGKLEAKASISGGVSFNNSTTREISDVDIENISKGSTAAYVYKINNLPIYDIGAIALTDPPAIARSNSEFKQSWIWWVPKTAEGSGESNLFMITRVVPVYESCHFITTGADLVRNSWTDALESSGTVITKIHPPSRVPTGRILIKNDRQGEFITDIVICNVKTPTKPYLPITESFSSTQTFSSNIPTGSYTVTFKSGTDMANIKNYVLSRENVEITRGIEVTLNSKFDFKEVK